MDKDNDYIDFDDIVSETENDSSLAEELALFLVDVEDKESY